MSDILAGKIAIITGVSRSGHVGQAVAAALAQQGASLAIVARTQANLDARAEELRLQGAQVLPLIADLTDAQQVNAMTEKVIAAYGKVDILVNLAGGLTYVKPMEKFSLKDWTDEMNNNLLATFLCSRSVFPYLKENGGSIINFSRASEPQANMIAYNCAKAGIEALTRTLALEGRDFQIRVNSVAPSAVDTLANIGSTAPKNLKRWTKRDDIAATVVFLVSDAAKGITGQTIRVTDLGI